MKSKSILKFFLIAAILVGFSVRFWKISTLPFPPNGDEIAFGYYGWSLLHFGTDEYGNFLPLNFPSIGDFKYPGLAYLNTLPAAIFGLTDITIRFWSALSGVILVILVYKFSQFVFKDEYSAVTSAWLAALSPWSIITSRLGWENHLSMVLTLGAVVSLISVIDLKTNQQKNKKNLLIISLLLFILSSFTYAAQRIFIPLILLSILFLSFLKNSEFKIIRKNVLIIFIIMLFTIALSLLPKANRGRSDEEAWKGLTPEQEDRLQQLYVQAGTSPIRIPARVTWFFHNKYSVSIIDFLNRYTDHFSPKFLFFFGEASNEKIPDMGVLLFIELVLFPFGLLTLFTKQHNTRKTVVVTWLIFAPVASALTRGGAHINRASLMIPPIALISGWGLINLQAFFAKRFRFLITLILGFGIVLSGLYVLNQIFIQKPMDKPWIKEQVYKEIVLEILKTNKNYEAVVVGDDDYIFFLFYGKISPQEFLQRSVILPIGSGNWERVERLDNIYFKMPFNCPRSGKIGVLYVCSGNEVPQNSKVLKTFYYLDKVPAYTFIEFYPLSKLPTSLSKLPENLHYMVDVEKNPDFPDGIIPENYPSFW